MGMLVSAMNLSGEEQKTLVEVLDITSISASLPITHRFWTLATFKSLKNQQS